jgi:putative glutamine amidotransferase
MPPRIAIPLPHSFDSEYAERSIPQYEEAVRLTGGEPVRIPLDQTSEEVKKIIERCDGVLLPGSKADVDPKRFHAERSPHTAAADVLRHAVDAELLEDAYKHRKPVLGICYGLQSLNVFHGGSLIQHIPDFLPPATRGKVNHEAGKDVPIAHNVEIDPNSTLAEILSKEISCGDSRPRLSIRAKLGSADKGTGIIIPVNSSHHQSADAVGNNLRVVARCTADNIIEAVEGTAPDHFVVAVQWHPERSVRDDEESIAIFRALIKAAEARAH